MATSSSTARPTRRELIDQHSSLDEFVEGNGLASVLSKEILSTLGAVHLSDLLVVKLGDLEGLGVERSSAIKITNLVATLNVQSELNRHDQMLEKKKISQEEHARACHLTLLTTTGSGPVTDPDLPTLLSSNPSPSPLKSIGTLSGLVDPFGMAVEDFTMHNEELGKERVRIGLLRRQVRSVGIGIAGPSTRFSTIHLFSGLSVLDVTCVFPIVKTLPGNNLTE
jgi:hypothetical protein